MTMTAASSHDQLIALISGLSDQQASTLTPSIADLVENTSKEKGLKELDYNEFRKYLNLDIILPDPTITELTDVQLAGSGTGLEDQIMAGGYDSFNKDITRDYFALTLSAHSCDLVLAQFNIRVGSRDVEKWAAVHGYELALTDHLLAVGSQSKYRELQREFPIIALGSQILIRGCLVVPYLSRDDSDRILDLETYAGEWFSYHRFLLRKVPQHSAA